MIKEYLALLGKYSKRKLAKKLGYDSRFLTAYERKEKMTPQRRKAFEAEIRVLYSKEFNTPVKDVTIQMGRRIDLEKVREYILDNYGSFDEFEAEHELVIPITWTLTYRKDVMISGKNLAFVKKSGEAIGFDVLFSFIKPEVRFEINASEFRKLLNRTAAEEGVPKREVMSRITESIGVENTWVYHIMSRQITEFVVAKFESLFNKWDRLFPLYVERFGSPVLDDYLIKIGGKK